MKKSFLICLFMFSVSGLCSAGDHGDIIVYQIDRDLIGKVSLKPVEVFGPLWGDSGYSVFAERKVPHHNPGDPTPEYKMDDVNMNPAFCKGLSLLIDGKDSTISLKADYSACPEQIQKILQKTDPSDFVDGIAAAILYTNNGTEEGNPKVSSISVDVSGVGKKPIVKKMEWTDLRVRYRPRYKFVVGK